MTEEAKKMMRKYDLICDYFKHTFPSFDYIDWTGKYARVFKNDKLIEKYSLEDLHDLMPDDF
jgi:hypothetical protein